jgi:hypothetical protein
MKRRTFIRLIGGSVLAAGNIEYFCNAGRAEGSSGVPVLGLISQAFDFMKRSGDMELELNAINLKLDQILRNQQALFSALQAMNETLDNVQRYITEIPSEIISLNQVIDAQSRFKSVADNISALHRRPQDKKALALLQQDRDRLYELSNELFAAVGATTRPPGFTIAANHILNAATLINRYDTSSSKRRNSTTDSERFKSLTFNVMSTLQTMTGDAGIKTRFPLLNEKFKLRKADVLSQPFSRLLPKDFDQPIQGENQEANVSKSMCLMSGVSPTTVHHEVLRDTNASGHGTHVSGFLSDVRETRSLKKIQYEVTSLKAFGGRRAFEVTMKPPETWGSDGWSRVVRHQSDFDDKELSSEPRAKLDGCVEIDDSAHGAPRSLGTFQGYLQGYSALVALESRLLVLQHVGEDDLKRATSLYDRLG